MIKQLLQQAKTLATRYRPGRQRQSEQNQWESRWATPDFAPSWRIQTIPHELEEVVAQQWFSPGGHLLDIGCGRGECANWLAQKGFTVLGIDFAPSAIARAQATYPENERLQFRVLDICQAVPDHSFQFLFDRGCYHTIPEANRPHYVQHVASAASPGAHFLLLHRTHGDPNQPAVSPDEQAKRNQQTFDQIKREFQATFEIVEMKPSQLPRVPPALPVPSVVLWLVRR